MNYMKQFVTVSNWAYMWTKNIGDREYMKQFITEYRVVVHVSETTNKNLHKGNNLND